MRFDGNEVCMTDGSAKATIGQTYIELAINTFINRRQEKATS